MTIIKKPSTIETIEALYILTPTPEEELLWYNTIVGDVINTDIHYDAIIDSLLENYFKMRAIDLLVKSETIPDGAMYVININTGVRVIKTILCYHSELKKLMY